MIQLRRHQHRGHFNYGWLNTYHTFSFGQYQDPHHMGFRSLRVINEDRVAPGHGFGMHPHRDMEILTYVLSGELQHSDNLGHQGVIRPGEVQYMAAGTGVIHSETNPSATETVHFIQIWIVPDRAGTSPRYEQRTFPTLADAGDLVLLASSNGRDGSIAINQAAEVRAARLAPGAKVQHRLEAGRGAWLQVLRGDVRAETETLHSGDGAAIIDQRDCTIVAVNVAEVLLFDLP